MKIIQYPGLVPAKEKFDSLSSTSYAQILDVISEGEIVGLVDDLKSVYLDGVPVFDKNGAPNFSGVFVDSRSGSQNQSAINGFPSAESEVGVGVEIKNSAPVVRSINTYADAVSVRIGVNQLTVVNQSTGEIDGGEVYFAIDIDTDGSGWVQKAYDFFNGKCLSKYQREIRIFLDKGLSHQIRVRRVTPDTNSPSITDIITWDSYTIIIDAKLRHPNTALMAVRVDASQFSTIPSRSYDIYGLKIKVPSNYDSTSKKYVGFWDGTFKMAWSNNPAWVFYDMATNSRYGAAIPENQINKWGLYSIGAYCDELINDGFGNLQPRMTTNCYIQTREEAFNLLRDLANRFRGIYYFQSGLLDVSQDSPADPSFLFTRSNVIDGRFNYSGTSKANRYTVVLVTWTDLENGGKQTVEYVGDDGAIAEFGVIQKEITLIGCTNRGEAHREGLWYLYVSQHETESVSFKISIEGANLRLGHIIKVQDPIKDGSRMSGRIVSATINSIIVDDDLNVDLVNNSYTAYVTLANGKIEQRLVSNYNARRITFSTNFSSQPHNRSTWILSKNNVEPKTYRVISIAEDNKSFSVTALLHNSSKYDYIEKNLKLEERSFISLSAVPEIPKDLKVTENLYESFGVVKNKATFSWQSSARAAGYRVFYKPPIGNKISLGVVSSNEIEILDLNESTYEFSVYAVSAIGYESAIASITYEILGKKIPPANVQNFSLMPLNGYAQLTWKKADDIDVLNGGLVRIRYSPDNLNIATWKNSVDVALLPGNATQAQVALQSGTYMAMFVDSVGNSSLSESFVYTNIPEAKKINVVDQLIEHPGFIGNKLNMQYSSEYLGLVLIGDQTIDAQQDIDSLFTIDFAGGVASSGSYEASRVINVGGLFSCKVSLNLKVEGVDISDKIDSRVELVDSWPDIDGSNLSTVNVKAFMATTEDNPDLPGAVWTPWKPFFVGEYKAYGFKFKIEATSERKNHSVIVKEFGVTVDMPDRTEAGSNINSSVSGFLTVNYEKPFKAAPSLMITAQNLSSGDNHVIENKTENGFQIKFVNSAGVNVIRTFDYSAVGYGRKI